MNKKRVVILTLIILLLCASLFACTKTPVFLFSQKTYSIYLDSKPTITPGIISESNLSYSLNSSNDSIVKVENNKIIGLKEGTVTLTATAGKKTTTAKIIVFKEKMNPYEVYESDGKHVVYFSTTTTPAQQESHFERVSNGEIVSDPGLYKEPILGFVFAGWYEDIAFKKPFDFLTPIYKSINLFPKFVPDKPYFESESFEDSMGNVKYRLKGLTYTNVPYDKLELPNEYHLKDKNGNITASYPFEQIADSAFFENASIEEVIIPGNYKVIGKSAFESTKKLKAIHLTDGATHIGEKAFANNEVLTTFTSKNIIENMGDAIFANCTNLSSATIKDAYEISNNAFYNTGKLEGFSIGENVTKLGENAFAKSGLKSINLNNVKYLSNNVFIACNALANIDGNVADFDFVGDAAFGKIEGLSGTDETAWLLQKANSSGTNGIVKYKNALILAVNLGLKQYFEIKNASSLEENISFIASNCFSKTANATILFELSTPPKLGHTPFGRQDYNGNIYPNVTIIVSAPNLVEPYINKWLEIAEDENGGKDYTLYSWSLANQIHAEHVSENMMQYGYRDEIRATVNANNEPTWEFIRPGYRAVIINQLLKNLEPTSTEINVINDINSINSIRHIGSSDAITPIKTTLEIIKPYGINDESSTTANYSSKIKSVILPNSGFIFREQNEQGLNIQTNPTVIQKDGIKLPLENSSIHFLSYGEADDFRVTKLVTDRSSQPPIYPSSGLKIYVQNVQEYKNDSTWTYIKDLVFQSE